MPFARLVPAGLLAATFLVLSTGQRLLLTWLLAPRLAPSLSDVTAILARGARADAAWTAAALLPVALWCSLLPERAWKSRLHRLAAAAGFGAALLAIITFVTVDALQFSAHHARLGPPLRERMLVAWRMLAGDGGPVVLGVLVVLGCGAAALGIGLVLRRSYRSAWKAPTPALLRARDLILVLAACVGAIALHPRGAMQSGRPVLDELAASSLPALATCAARGARSWTK